jgi:hypothetical protein
MRVKTYYRMSRNGESNYVEQMEFQPEHYREARTLNTSEFGMNEVTAVMLVNKWNRESNGNYIYWV